MKTKSIVIAVIIAIGVVAIPLWLKSNRTSSTSATHAHETATSAGETATSAGETATSAGETATSAGETATSRKVLPRFVDLGTTTCAPCKVMLGVMSELEQTYPGAMEIEFVNVREQRGAAQRYGIRVIPTQIFYTPDGRELFRHTGVYRAEQVIAKWAELGYPMQPSRER